MKFPSYIYMAAGCRGTTLKTKTELNSESDYNEMTKKSEDLKTGPQEFIFTLNRGFLVF